MQFAGHAPAQLPQEIQVSASITRTPSSFALMAPTGHSPSQAPQEMQQPSEITYAMFTPLSDYFTLSSNIAIITKDTSSLKQIDISYNFYKY